MKSKGTILLLLAAGAALFYFFINPKVNGGPKETFKEISPVYDDILKSVTAMGIVQPQNRLEIKPPISGRVDKILVKEGDEVKIGQIVALMSSTERAALLDAARSKGEKELSYWEEIYKPIPLVAPIDGTVIVSTMQPGQSITQTDPILVLSDRLIVQAQVDETDIGKIEEGRPAVITLDAYPDISVEGRVSHIYHESKTVNNVTIYQVDILPDTIPAVFRSGMSANVRVIEEKKENVLTLPSEVIKSSNGQSFVFVKDRNKKPARTQIETGLSDGTLTEIISGVGETDIVMQLQQKYAPAKGQKAGSNPFLPGGGQRRNNRS